ncbi:MAG TPA: DUF2089 domain-containing protein [Firmicutes bacterium]|nr:DUF2089 domain-containing protein [Candidatus Fermentithermobacillaceae bacterium]
MSREVIGTCPVCGGTMEVTEIHCPSCNTRISGCFHMDKFSKLTPEQRAFTEIFIKCRGNIKEVERELGVSYPTVRSRLEAVIQALGYPVSTDSDSQSVEDWKASRQKEILDKLGAGEITAKEAVRMLRALR